MLCYVMLMALKLIQTTVTVARTAKHKLTETQVF